MLSILGSLILQAAYGAVDLLVVGRFGSTAVLGGAAVVFALLSAGMFVLVACVVNIVGDLLLVAVFHLDAAGAAIATVLAQAVSVVFAVAMLIPSALMQSMASFVAPNASLTKIGLAAPVSTAVGIALNVAFYLYLNRRERKAQRQIA